MKYAATNSELKKQCNGFEANSMIETTSVTKIFLKI